MANRLGRAVRGSGVFEFSGRGRISEQPSIPAGDGGLGAAVQSAFGGLSRELGELADRAAKREGEAEGYAAGEAANPSRPQPESPPSVAGGSSTPRGSGGYYDRVIGAESGGNPNAKNPKSSATGLGQFIGDTWLGVVKSYRPDLMQGRSKDEVLALRKDPAIAREMLQHFTQENARELRSAGFEQSDANLYLMHFAGKGGAINVLRAPDTKPVEQILDAGAIAANGFLRGMTAADLKAWSARKMGGGSTVERTANRAGPPAAASDGSVGGIPIHEPLPGAAPVRTAPPAPPAPLALRRDGTVKGEAFDAAAVRVYGAKLEAGIRADTAEAYAQHKDDPAALQARLGEIRSAYEADATFKSDPELRLSFQKRFDQQSAAYLSDANARAERRIDDEAKASSSTALAGVRQDLERQAYVLGSNPSGDQNLEAQLVRMDAAADYAASRGDITPTARDAYKRDARETIVSAKIRGTFDALPTTEAKRKFADGLVKAWSTGEGEIAKLDRKTVDTLGSQLTADAKREAAEGRAADATQRAQLKRRLDDDVSSIASTGKNLVVDGVELTEDRVAEQLGRPAADKWTADRQRARALYSATSDLKMLSEDEISERIATLKPTPGSEGYADAEKVQELAMREAAKVLKARTADPGAAADAFAEVQRAKAARDPKNPATFEATAQARLDAQDALGVPETARQPLSNAEAKALVQPVLKAQPGTEYQALRLVMADVEGRYGRHADAVASQLLEQTGISKYEAETGFAILKSIRRGQQPTAAEGRAGDVAGDVGQSGRAMEGRAQPATPAGPRPSQTMSRAGPAPQIVKDRMKPAGASSASGRGPDPAYPMPNTAQVQMLVRRPDLRREFEAKFGAGSADFYTRPNVHPADEE